ncbi:carboxypeptidase-like regulatory domain-containing protein [Marinifilum sp.]|uniref:carboxypeptidase-like regulatory domain-containing protein n=1 Tax=Marinifilum sp. TaxID=2033137 RepID=UPI003BA8DA22
MRRILFAIIIAIIPSTLLAQKTITGSITDKNRNPIAGSSIFIKDSYLGSISNRDGMFSITIPQKIQSGILCISCIGYQKKEILIDAIKSPIKISLQKDTCNLAEVLVMPKDTLLALLRQAYGKIKDNYPDFDTRMKGFYRESYLMPETNEYLYFGEAILDIFKTAYSNSSPGQVKLVKSRMNKHPLYHQYSSVMWYGGLHFPLNSDDVKRQVSYFTPKGFKKYDYTIYKDKLENQPVYRIEFKPKENQKASYKGKFYLDINSLAYLYSECEFSDYGFKKRNRYLALKGLKVKQRKEKLKYKFWNGKYYLSYISSEEKLYDNKTQSDLIHFNEYLTTKISSENVEPILFKDQVELRDVFYVKAKKYSESEWKNQTNIVPDSSLNKLIEYSSQEANQLLTKKHSLPKGYKFKQKLIEIITRMYFDIDFEIKPTSEITNASILYAPTSNQSFSNINIKEKRTYSYGMKMGYKLHPYFDVNFRQQENIGRNLSELKSLGIAYETPIINRGNQLFLMCGVNYFFSRNGNHIDDFKSSHTFKGGGKKIRADKIGLYIGKKKQGVSFDLGLRTKLSGLYSVFVMAGYQFNTEERDRLFIKEKSGFFLTRKTTDISLSDSSIQYFENGVQTTKTSFDTDDFYLKAGIRFAF